MIAYFYPVTCTFFSENNLFTPEMGKMTDGQFWDRQTLDGWMDGWMDGLMDEWMDG